MGSFGRAFRKKVKHQSVKPVPDLFTFFGEPRTDRTPYGVDLIFEAVLVRFKGRQRCGALVELSDETRWRRGYGGSED